MSSKINLIFRNNMNDQLNKIKEKNKNIRIWSYSKLGTFNQCPRGYYYSYVDKKNQTQNIYSIIGEQIHETLQELYEDKTDVLDKGRFDKAFEMCSILGIDFPVSQYDIAGNYKRDIDNFYKYYKRFPTEEGKQFICELGFILKVSEIDYIIGYIDLLILNPDGTCEIWDFKTSSLFKDKKLLSAGHQLILYKLAIEQLYGIPVTKVGWEMVKYVSVKIGKNKEKNGLQGRNWVEKCSSQIKTLLKKEVGDEAIAELMLAKAVADNTIESLPQSVQDQINIRIYRQEYNVTQELIDEFWSYTKGTIDTIESKEEISDEFPKKCDQFFCSNLCGFRRDYCNGEEN